MDELKNVVIFLKGKMSKYDNNLIYRNYFDRQFKR